MDERVPEGSKSVIFAFIKISFYLRPDISLNGVPFLPPVFPVVK
jgi:hypothetical protein